MPRTSEEDTALIAGVLSLPPDDLMPRLDLSAQRRKERTFAALERRTPGSPALRVVAAPDEFFRADSWWRNRQGRKIAFMEWAKTFAAALGI